MGLFDEQVSRKPNHYPWTQDIIDALWHSHWTANEFSFRSDYSQFHSELTDEERKVVVRTLSAVGQIEIAVKRFWTDLGKTFPHPSMSDMGIVMGNNEVIHNQAYEKLLDVLGLQSAFDEALKEPALSGRVQYLRKYLNKVYEDDRKQYVYALILFTLFIENCSLFSQFYTMMHFNRTRALLKDTAQQIQYTRNEELLHAQAGILLINTLRKEYPELFDEELENRVKEECWLAIGYESNLIDWMLDGYTAEGLTSDILKAYTKNRMKEAMIAIGFDTIKLTAEEELLLEYTLWADEETYGTTMTDFFQKRPVEYAKNNRDFASEELF
jgi:ribonucleoside-diphosphate reductase beta chain